MRTLAVQPSKQATGGEATPLRTYPLRKLGIPNQHALASDFAAGLIEPISAHPPRGRVLRDVVVNLDVSNRAAAHALAEMLGELAADLWLDGKLDVG